ncbi:indolepyruvate ferredoxin oxidoreductase family protein [Limnobacter parvus]|uniref:Indolepyruvate ferredoxin oxidoreductase family protein n=1 Tax=Limnobacter parvus TaxID=2939690 RepID=A0ABT1XER8_9BURK|nr:indolepyruvate ferredoxin oxidoreductase family protein [Limnobacter parvus]MCR2745634.1 indolepyruvate ferredoxin oxidoreductase family protein [Limnobacter parvus]
MNAPYHPAYRPVELNDKYSLPKGRVFLTGAQALVRLTLLQAEVDRINGLNTGGFVSGYRGSPLGGVDQAFWGAEKFLKPLNIHFQPGLNEDLAATSVWGSQQLNLFQGAKVDGVFGLWYGKGPGVDRSLDVFKHANAAGTSKHGGVLLVAGDDHAAKSSTLPHQSDHVLKAALIPVLYPSNVQEIIDFGMLGYSMSRYAGVWVGLKTVADVVECSATVDIDPQRHRMQLPTDFTMPEGGLNIRWPDTALAQEARLIDHKLYAALAFARANGINRTVIDSPHARFGIVATGKAYQDTLQALNDLGLTPQRCAEIGIRVFKVGMVWPLDAVGIRDFAQGLQEILVVEEKRQLVEYQIKEELYAWREDVRPKVYGKFDERLSEDGREGGEWSLPQGSWLLPSHYELDPALIAQAVAKRLQHLQLPVDVQNHIASRIQAIAQRHEVGRPVHLPVERKPYFCSGCPHNTSTKVPEGSRAMAGIGCHYMAVWMDRNTQTYTQMGGEGVPWIGQAPFTETQHVFANLGDGTYFHSGILAIRASVSAGVNITYKLLYNDAVAMTGGQQLDGTLTVPQLTRQLAAEGVAKIVIVSDNPEQHRRKSPVDPLAEGIEVFDRRDMDTVQKTLRNTSGTTVLVYEQTCASEKRRRRKRTDPATGKLLFPNPAKRVLINPRVCEGCGDCSKHSNCLSIEPVSTPWGVKRTINQSTCNKDYSCLEGLCPSLVTVEGAELVKRKNTTAADALAKARAGLAEPRFVVHPDALDKRYAVLINGVGGTGVVTIGAWLGMAAHLQGMQALGLDMAGLAQKGGAVFSHVQFAPAGTPLASSKIPVGEADLMIGGDLLVSAHEKTLELLSNEAFAVVNTDTPPTADFIAQRDWCVPVEQTHADIARALKHPEKQFHPIRAQWLADQLLGDTVYANAFLLGVVWQHGFLPLHLAALRRAIELNGVKVKENLLAFDMGRLAVQDLPALELLLPMQKTSYRAESADEQLDRYQQELARYQNKALADRFTARVLPLRALFEACGRMHQWVRLCSTYYKLLAFKDEYEVARLHSDPQWRQETLGQFEPGANVYFHFAPAWLAGHTDRPRKIKLGVWVRPVLKALAAIRGIRGTWIDPFKGTLERKNQTLLMNWFESWIELMHNNPSMVQHSKSVNHTLDLFNQVKGFGQVRIESFDKVRFEIQKSVENKTNLDQHDEDRQQT